MRYAIRGGNESVMLEIDADGVVLELGVIVDGVVGARFGTAQVVTVNLDAGEARELAEVLLRELDLFHGPREDPSYEARIAGLAAQDSALARVLLDEQEDES